MSTPSGSSMNALKNKANFGMTLGKSSMGYIVTMIIILLVAMGLWYVYSRRQSTVNSKFNPVYVTDPTYATDTKFTSQTGFALPPESPYGLQYTYSFWLNVHDLEYRYNQDKVIARSGSVEGTLNPMIFISAVSNNLMVRIKNRQGQDTFGVQNIPLMRWVHVAVVLNNRNVDIYMDGKLERSHVLSFVPSLPNANSEKLFICNDGGYQGRISKFQYFSKALGPSDIYNVYISGPMTSTIFK
jgi:Concanavalin A-like lectin/glucanases superfamily